MNYTEIGKHGEPEATSMMVSLLIRGKVKTLNVPLAVAIAKVTGKPPKAYLSKKIVGMAVRDNPQLSLKPKD
jgi:hypothetical protein